MKQLYAGALGGLLGAGVMYVLDPAYGRRRRGLVRDRAIRAAHGLGDAATRTAADVRHRTRGLGARARHLIRQGLPDERVLEERVRARLGRCCSHAHAIDVLADGGVVELSGPILASEVRRLLHEVGRVPGVREIRNLLEPHDRPENIPSLQGAPPIWDGQHAWTPAGRLLGGLAGGGLLAASFRLRSPLCYGTAGAGLGLLARSLSNRSLLRLAGLDQQRQAIHLEKTFEVLAPVPAVFALWSKFEAFPRFLSHVKEVRRTDDGNYRWEVTGPIGSTVAWMAQLSRYIPNRAIAWQSLPGSPVETTGQVRFRESNLGTRVELRMSYRPPAGAVGHGIAKLLGADPRKQIDEDVIRLKSLLEEGKATGRQETVDSEQIIPGLGASRPPGHGG